MNICALGYVGFKSPNHEKWRQYAPDVLAMQLAPDGRDGSIRLRMDERHHRIAIHPGEDEDLAYIGWELPNRKAFDDALEELEAKKIAFEVATVDELRDRCVLGMISLADPSGFRHELFWGQTVEGVPFLPARPHPGYVGDELGGIGHIVLAVPALTKAHAKFATEVLGFRSFAYLTFEAPDGTPMPVEVYRCNERSHCLVWTPAPGMRGIGHIYLETKTLHDLGRTYDLLKERELPISMELGSFVIDNDVSFYMRTPSGWDIEYAWDFKVGRNRDSGTSGSHPTSGGKSVAWGHKILLPIMNPSIRPVAVATDAPGSPRPESVSLESAGPGAKPARELQ